MKTQILARSTRPAFSHLLHRFSLLRVLVIALLASKAAHAVATVYTPPASLAGAPIAFATDYQVKADNQNVAVYDADPTDLYQALGKAIPGWNPGVFASFEFSSSVTVSMTVPGVASITSAVIQPKRLGITPTISGKTITFTMNQAANIGIDINGNIGRPLWIFANPPETNKPAPTDAGVLFFAAGNYYNAGDIDLNGYSQIYIEGGAVVRGTLLGGNLGPGPKKIRGRGIVCNADSSVMKVGENNDMTIDGITMVGLHPNNWTAMLTKSNRTTVNNIKIMGIRRDAFDPLGCQNLTVSNSFFYSYDDSIAIKAWQYSDPAPVDNIMVKDSVLWNHGLVLGFESRSPIFRNITAQNLDIIRPRDNTGMRPEIEDNRVGVLKIDISDRAVCSNVTFDNIRIYDPVAVDLFGARVASTYASTDPGGRGSIDGVTFKNIDVLDVAPGEPLWSGFRGTDATHNVKNINFQNIKINGQLVVDAAQMRLRLYNFADPLTFTGFPLCNSTATNKVLNSSFEENADSVGSTANWQEAGPNQNASYVERRSETNQDGAIILTQYLGTPFEVYTYQVLTGLPNGTYTLRVRGKRYSTAGTVYAQATTPGGASWRMTPPYTNDFQTMEIPGVIVTNGIAEIGFYANNVDGTPVKYDKVEFFQTSSSGGLGTGTGLSGQYYSGTAFQTLVKTQTDPKVDFNWGSGSPQNLDGTTMSSVGPDNFSVRWNGQVQAIESGTYTFRTVSDDGVRLWLNDTNGAAVIDNWTNHGATNNDTTITLTAGQKINLKMEYYEAGGGAVAQLQWLRPGQSAFAAVPTTQLYRFAVPSIGISTSRANGRYGLGETIYFTASANSASGQGIDYVEYLANGVSIGSSPYASTYDVAWKPTATGTYSVVGKAVQGNGVSGTSAPFTVVVF